MLERPNDGSVNELFQIVERLVDDERSRGQGLETKTSTLAGSPEPYSRFEGGTKSYAAARCSRSSFAR